MKNRKMVLIFLINWLFSNAAFGFAEDVCFLKQANHQNEKIVDCVPTPDECYPGIVSGDPKDPASVNCTLKLMQKMVPVQLKSASARSTFHTDATYIIAQLAGFSKDASYWMAAYDQATDMADYQPYDKNGNKHSDTSKYTKNIEGITRMNWRTGGILFHFHPAFTKANVVDSKNLDLTNNAHQELLLSHMKAWVKGESQSGLCAGGLTTKSDQGDFATGVKCYQHANSRYSNNLAGTLNIVPLPRPGKDKEINSNDLLSIPFSLPIQKQQIGPNGETSDDIAKYIGTDFLFEKKLGMYLHAVGDKVSHSNCVDSSSYSGPHVNHRKRSARFIADMSSDECSQVLHLIRHAWESGIEQNDIPNSQRTLRAGLSIIFDEIYEMAKFKGLKPKLDPILKAQVIQKIESAIEQKTARKRIEALNQVTIDYKLKLMPGY